MNGRFVNSAIQVSLLLLLLLLLLFVETSTCPKQQNHRC